MRAIISAENEAFKLKINAANKTSHNFSSKSNYVQLTACRNSFAAFQIVMQCDFRCCIKLNDAPWFSEYSDASVLAIRHEGELKPVMNHIGMYLADDGCLYGDCLKSDPVVDAEADVPAGVFVRFEIPKDMMPGEYSGVFKVFPVTCLMMRCCLTVSAIPLPSRISFCRTPRITAFRWICGSTIAILPGKRA